MNGLVGRDETPGRSTVILSEENVLNSANRDLAKTPSLRSIRHLIAEIFLERAAKLEIGAIFFLDISSLRLRYDLDGHDVLRLQDFLEEEGLIASAGGSSAGVLYVNGVPQACYPHDNKPLQGEVDLFRVLEHLGFSQSEKRHFDFNEYVQSGVLEHVNIPRYTINVRAFRLLRHPQLSQEEINRLVEGFGAILRSSDEYRTRRRRELLEIFTKKRCFVAGVAQALGVLEQMPEGWRSCGLCLFCRTHKAAALPINSRSERGVDPKRLQAVIRAVPKRFADPRSLSRIALGVHSHRVKAMGITEASSVFGSMRLNTLEVCHYLALFPGRNFECTGLRTS